MPKTITPKEPLTVAGLIAALQALGPEAQGKEVYCLTERGTAEVAVLGVERELFDAVILDTRD